MTKIELFLLRRKKKIRLKQISEFIGVSVATVSNFETGQREQNEKFRQKYEEFITQY